MQLDRRVFLASLAGTAAALAARASMVIKNGDGTREVGIDDFVVDSVTTAVEEGEVPLAEREGEAWDGEILIEEGRETDGIRAGLETIAEARRADNAEETFVARRVICRSTMHGHFGGRVIGLNELACAATIARTCRAG